MPSFNLKTSIKKMKSFREFLEESLLEKPLHRFDHGPNPPKKFYPSQSPTYHVKNNFSVPQSNVKTPRMGATKEKGTYAAAPAAAAPYAVPRNIPWAMVEKPEHRLISAVKKLLGKPPGAPKQNLLVKRSDYSKIKTARPTLSIFKGSERI